MRIAGKFGLPVVTLIDTSGANPGIESEEDGLGPAMADCLATMLDVPAPTVAVITGEGCSEAAVALAAADRVLMLDNAVYEVLKPEDAARIYRDSETTSDLAERLTITSHDCLRLGIADGLVPEPGEGAHTNHDEAAAILRRAILRELVRIEEANPRKLRSRRYDRYRHTGTTRARVRGTLERRRAHLFDRIGLSWDRLRRNAARRRSDGGESPEIPV
jgi:acetyl-CoA carboxylase carboxyl transferase subunit beta